PRVDHFADRLARRRFERLPEVAGLGVGELMLLQIEADSVAEEVVAEKLLEHPEHGGALLVGEDVEHRAAVFGTQHWKFYRPRAAQAVYRHRGGARDAETFPSL